MRKTLLVLGIMVAALLLNTSAFASVNDDQVTSQKIKEADGTSGQNTNSGSGVKTGHIQKGAVTPDKIGFYNNVIVVAPSGGNFTSPVDAVNSISGASMANPYLVKIMPGVYDISSSFVQMKPYVDVEGSGENVTKIIGSGSAQIAGASNAELRYLTVQASGGSYAINSTSGSFTVSNVTILPVGGSYALYVGGDTVVKHTKIIMADGGGIYVSPGFVKLTDITISANNCWGATGAVVQESKAFLKNININLDCSTSNRGIFSINSQMDIINANIAVPGSGSGADTHAVSDYGTSVVKIDNSIMKGVWAVYTLEGGTAYIGNTKLDGAVFKSGSSDTVKCSGVHDGDYNLVTCP